MIDPMYKTGYATLGRRRKIHLVDQSRPLIDDECPDRSLKYPLLCSYGRFFKNVEFTNSFVECERCKILQVFLETNGNNLC